MNEKELKHLEQYYKKYGDRIDQKTVELIKILSGWGLIMDDIRFAVLKNFIQSLDTSLDTVKDNFEPTP